MPDDQPLSPWRQFTDANLGPLAISARASYAEIVQSINMAAHLRGINELLAIAASARPPDTIEPQDFKDIDFPAKDGWTVTIFYDGGELDYIDHFTTPDGQTIRFWDWNEDVPGRSSLINWRSVDDTARLTIQHPSQAVPATPFAFEQRRGTHDAWRALSEEP